jgi:hypothetical protein
MQKLKHKKTFTKTPLLMNNIGHYGTQKAPIALAVEIYTLQKKKRGKAMFQSWELVCHSPVLVSVLSFLSEKIGQTKHKKGAFLDVVDLFYMNIAIRKA